MQVRLPRDGLGISPPVIIITASDTSQRADEFLAQQYDIIRIAVYFRMHSLQEVKGHFIPDAIGLNGPDLFAGAVRVRTMIIIGEGLRHEYRQKRIVLRYAVDIVQDEAKRPQQLVPVKAGPVDIGE